MREQLCTHQGHWRSRDRGCSRHWSWDAAAAHGGQGMQGSTCSPWSRQNHAGAGGCLRGGCDLMGSLHWSRNLQTCGERSPCCSRFPGRTCDTMGDPHWSSLSLQDCTLWKSDPRCSSSEICCPWAGLNVGEVHGELSPIGGAPYLAAGEGFLSGSRNNV